MSAHDFRLITAMAYALVGLILFACGRSIRFRFLLLRSEPERALMFQLVAIFIYACFLDHLADSAGAEHSTRWAAALFEAVVSTLTALFLIYRAGVRGLDAYFRSR